jgi:hypothetical protein
LLYFQERNSFLINSEIFLVKIEDKWSVKSSEKSAKIFPQVFAIKFDALFQTTIKSASSFVSFKYEFTFFITFILYHQQSHLFEVIITAKVFFQFLGVENIGNSLKCSSTLKNTFNISSTKSLFSKAKS